MHKDLTIPGGTGVSGRLVVIGDVHGQAELFRDALNSVRDPKGATLILLGDLIDRGPDSKGVLELARQAEERFGRAVILPGNHEQMLWFASRPDGFSWSWSRSFLGNGGDRTLWEFDHDVGALLSALPRQMTERLAKRAPLWHREGNLLFVHAGINPHMDPEEFLADRQDHHVSPGDFQESLSPLWVRHGFYAAPGHSGPYEAPGGDDVVVVYGHTRVGEPDMWDHLMRVEEDLAEWRVPMDATGADFLPVMEVDGESVRMTTIPAPHVRNRIGWDI